MTYDQFQFLVKYYGGAALPSSSATATGAFQAAVRYFAALPSNGLAGPLRYSPTEPNGRNDDQGRWKFQLLNRSQASEEIWTELETSGFKEARVGKNAPVKDALTYLKNHRVQLDYAAARRLGLAIASGPLEATCKSLFNQRFKRSGSRWKERTGEHILHLRALVLERFVRNRRRRRWRTYLTSLWKRTP